jgi:hypothetical protein
MTELYLSKFPQDILIHHILPLLKPKDLENLKNVNDIMFDLLDDDETYNKLIMIKFANVPNFFKTESKYKRTYYKLCNCKIMKLYLYNNYLVDVPIPKGISEEDSYFQLNKYVLSQYNNIIMIIPKHNVSKKLFKVIGTKIYFFDRYREFIHLVYKDQPFLVKGYTHQYDFGEYNIIQNEVYSIGKSEVKSVKNQDIQKFIDLGHFI